MKRITVHDKNTLPAGIGGLVRGVGVSNDLKKQYIEESLSTYKQKETPYLIEDLTLNGHLFRPPAGKEIAPASIEMLSNNYHEPRRYMHTKPSEKAESLNNQIDRFAERAASFLGISVSDFGNPGMPTTGKCTVVGRIIGEIDGKLSEKGILLETSRQIGSGCRVPLELDHSLTCHFFPGQLVVLEGHNPDGRKFIVSEVKPVSMMQTVSEKSKITHSGLSTSIITASGPFTLDDANGLDFGPFEKLLNFVHEQKCNALLLLGPFMDCDNSSIKSGKISNGLPDEVFQKEFLGRIRMLTSRNPNMKVIMVPSVRDILCDNVLPQPIIPEELFIETKNIILISNPATVAINGVMVAICSSDVILPLGMESMVKLASNSKENSDRIQALCSSLHQQASFLPIHPAPAGSNIDYARLADLDLEHTPDLWITPSQLRQFARNVEQCTFVNPGQFCRKQATGTLTLVTIANDNQKRVDFFQF